MKRRENFLKKLIRSKIFLAIGLIILVFFSLTLGKRVFEQRKINQEIKKLEEEIEILESRNSELSKLIEYLNTNLYIEEAARIKLGLQKPGESVVIVPNEIFNEQDEKKKENSQVNNKTILEQSNASKWWDYFFKN